MFKIKYLKEYTYTTICNIDFNVIVDFDCENEVELYSLWYEDHGYCSKDHLLEFEKSLTDEQIDSEIKSFMLDYICTEVDNYIYEEDLNDWQISTTEDGWKLENKKTHRCVVWKVHDLEDDCEFIQDEMIKFLNLQRKK